MNNTYIELFGKRVEGFKAQMIIVAIWLLPFFLGYLLGVLSARH